MRDIEQHPKVMMGDFNTHNLLRESETANTRGRMIEKLIDKFDLFCMNNKEKTCYKRLMIVIPQLTYHFST